MKKLLFSILMTISTIVGVYAVSNPTIGTITGVNINRGSVNNYVIISGISDGDANLMQNITVTAVSSDNNIVSVTSVNYVSGQKFAVINLTELATGTVSLDVTVTDPDGLITRSFPVAVGSFYPRGALWSVYDIVFWQNRVVGTSEISLANIIFPQMVQPSNTGSIYDDIPLTVGPASGLPKGDFSTQTFRGYIRPTVSGSYTFTATAQDRWAFQLSTNAQPTGQLLLDNRTATVPPITTASVNLVAGNAYWFQASHWVIHTPNLSIQWSGPGMTNRALAQPFIFPYNDFAKPSSPTVLTLGFKGTTSADLTWTAAIDNSKVQGYNIYLNGEKKGTSTTASFKATGLTPNVEYDVIVTAFDEAGNESFPSNTVVFTTFPVDNTPPTPPTAITSNFIGDASASISWSGAADVGSAVYGYNVYVNNMKVNTNGPVYGTTYVISALMELTNYSVTVSTLDGGDPINESVKSAPFNFTTLKFNPNVSFAGAKKARVNFTPTAVGRSEGFGVNAPYELDVHYDPSSLTQTLINDLKPSLLRWGGLIQNGFQFRNRSGVNGPNSTYAQFLKSCNDRGIYASIVIGVENSTDWMQSPQATALAFIEYLNGPTTSANGARRNAEGIPERLIDNSKGLIIELGNEVWGGFSVAPGTVNHFAQIGTNYTNYGAWCRSFAGFVMSSPQLSEETKQKIYLCYSGRYPDNSESFGLHEQLMPVGSPSPIISWLNLSGYLGGNLNYDPVIPRGTSLLSYYNSTYDRFNKNINGLKSQMAKFKPRIGGADLKFFLYESNMTTSDYNGRLGQAIIMGDYLMETQKWGSVLPSMFALMGGEWSLVDEANGNRRLPFFEVGKLLNAKAKGNILNSQVVTSEVKRRPDGSVIEGFAPLGAHVIYDDNGGYQFALFSRDFENDYQVQINLPNHLDFGGTGKQVRLTGADFDTKITVIDSSIINFRDSLIVVVPKHSMVLLSVTGTPLTQGPVPIGFTRHLKTLSTTITTLEMSNTIDVSLDFRNFTATGLPNNAVNKDIKWQLFNPSNLDIYTDILEPKVLSTGERVNGTFYIQANGTCASNGKLILRAMDAQDSTIYFDREITITNQIPEGVLLTCDPMYVITLSGIEGVSGNILTVNPSFSLNNLVATNLTITAPAGMLISTDNVTYSSIIILNTIDAATNANNFIYLKNATAGEAVTGNITIYTEGGQTQIVPLLDVSITSTDKVVHASKLVFYPNPTTSSCKFELQNGLIYSVKVTNTLGSTVINSQVNSSSTTIDLSSFSQGIYLVEINSSKGIEKVKLVKE